MTQADTEFAPIAHHILSNIKRQGFMTHVGAEVTDLVRGGCELSVDRRPELLQQNGFFHGGVTAFLIDNATTIAAATVKGQPALTAEYKLNLLSPASGDAVDLPCARRQAGTAGVGGCRRRVLFDRRSGKAHRDRTGIDCNDRREARAENDERGLKA